MRSSLFQAQHQERQVPDRWSLQSPRMLRTLVAPGQDVVATKGSMVAFQGQVQFHHESAGSVAKLMKKVVTSENAALMRVSGHGEVFFASNASSVFLIQLEGDGITTNASNTLAFDQSIAWDIKRLRGGGLLAGGLFNLELSGHGMVAVTSHGEPMILDCSQQPTFVDPQAAICWSANLTPSINNSMNVSSMLRGGSGEAIQLAFHGPGFVVVQPSEGLPVASGTS